MSRLSLFISVVLLVMVFGAVPSLNAVLITHSANFGGVPGFESALSLPKFDSSLGILNGIRFRLDLAIDNGWILADNDSDSAVNPEVTFGVAVYLSSSDVVLLNNAYQPIFGITEALNTTQMSLAADDGDGVNDVSPDGPDAQLLQGETVSVSRSDDINPMFLAGFIGSGSYNVSIFASSVVNFGGLAGIEGSFSPAVVESASSLSVIYDYSPIPEPATIILLLTGVAVTFRRKK